MLGPFLSSVLLLVPALAAVQEAKPALRGLDPVALVAGREVPGLETITLEHEGLRYAFSSEKQRETFRAAPESFAIQLGGACAAQGPLGSPGDPARFLVHEGRIYVFASDEGMAAFRADPDSYLDVPDPMPRLAEEQMARGKALLERVFEGMGGAAAIDGLAGLHVGYVAKRGRAPEVYTWREDLHYDFANGARELRTYHDDEQWLDTLRGSAGTSGEVGKEPRPMSTARREEFARQTGRELAFLLRAHPTVWAPRRDDFTTDELDPLVVRVGDVNTMLFVDPATGRVLRASWHGRLGTGPIGDVEMEFSVWEVLGNVSLPTVRTVTFDGERVAHLSGRLGRLTID